MSHDLNHTLFPASSHQTVREVFPHTAFLRSSHQGLCDLSGRGRFRKDILYPIVSEQSPFLVYLFPTPPLPTETASFLSLHDKLAHLPLDLVPYCPEGSGTVADPEVVHPAADDRIDSLDDFRKGLVPVRLERCLHPLADLFALLPSRRLADVGSPFAIAVEADIKPQKAEAAALFEVYDAGLFLVHPYVELLQLFLEPSLDGPKQAVLVRMPVDKDDHVVGASDKVKVVISVAPRDAPRSLHHLIDGVQIEVGQQGGDDASLRYALLAARLENELQEMHDFVVLHSPADFCQHDVVPDVIEVSAQVYVYNTRQTPKEPGGDSVHRLMGTAPGTIPVGAVFEVCLEDRFEDELERSLHDSVFDRRDAQHAGLSVPFRDLDPSIGHRSVPPVMELLPYPLQKSL